MLLLEPQMGLAELVLRNRWHSMFNETALHQLKGLLAAAVFKSSLLRVKAGVFLKSAGADDVN